MGLSNRAPRERSSARAAASACMNPSRPTSRASSRRAAGPRPTSRWSPTRPPAPGSPTRTTCPPAIPFEIVGGTSLSAPAWAGLLALVNQGRAAAGEAALNSASPTETAASPLQPAPERLQRHRQRQQRLHRPGRLQPGDRPGDAGGQSAGPRPGRLPRARARPTRARRSVPCRTPR